MPKVANFLAERNGIVQAFIGSARLLRLALFITLRARKCLGLGAQRWEALGQRPKIKAQLWLHEVSKVTGIASANVKMMVDQMEDDAMEYGRKL